ncbi:Aspartate/glutamate/uridylate kinase [Entophlyctis helioformis]|nr:Aspartate/glutamate/uridylate kinase [Entophlyctis helioformis]
MSHQAASGHAAAAGAAAGPAQTHVPATPTATSPSGGPGQRGLTLVIKLGTSSICDERTFMPKLASLSLLVETVVKLRSLGHNVLLVSSGAVGVGLRRLALSKRPKHLSQVQAVAAVGQGRLMALYDTLFSQYEVPIAQILLTRDNLAERSQYLNACNTLRELIQFNVVPIINENDSVSNAEIRFGDNDSLSAIAAGMVNADYLFLLTDVDALYTDNPRVNPNATAVRVVRDIRRLREQVTVSSPGSSLGTGGMVTKLIAAELATARGCAMVISIGSKPNLILDIIGEIQAHRDAAAENPALPFEPTIGTHFLPQTDRMVDRKWWIRHGLAPAGDIYIDAGAVRAIAKQKSSLFAAGITGIEGTFNAQQAVRIMTRVAEPQPRGGSTARAVVVAHGMVNYNSAEIQRIRGAKSSAIADLLGYMDSDFVIHRDNIAIISSNLTDDIAADGIPSSESE